VYAKEESFAMETKKKITVIEISDYL